MGYSDNMRGQHKRWGRTFAGLAVTACLLLAASPVFAAVPSSAGIGARPANPDPDNPRTQSIFLYTLNGGDSKTDQAFVSNGGDETATIELYAVDGVVANTGTFTCREEVEDRTDVGSWVKLSKTEITLAPRTNAYIDFTVDVPKNADVGEHNGCFVVQRKDQVGEVSGNVRVKTRQAVRVAIVVPGDIYRSVSVASFKTTQTFAGQNYELRLENKGNVSADVKADIRLKSIFGNEIANSGGQYPVLADESLDLNFTGEARPFFGGFYTAKATIAYDKRAGIYGVQDTNNLLYAESKPVWIFIWPSIWVFIVLAVLILGTAGYFIWRKQQRKIQKHAYEPKVLDQLLWSPYTIEEDDTIEKLALRHDITVEQIATFNRLQYPYTLKPGKQIYIPVDKKHTD